MRARRITPEPPMDREAFTRLRARVVAYEEALLRIAAGADKPVEIAIKVLTGAMA